MQLSAHKKLTLKMAAITYPSVRRDESAVEDHYGQQVADPYCWLEDPDSEETGQFVKDQNAVTMPYLEGCEARNKFHARYVQLADRTAILE